jgi:hypothetical protein
MKETTVDIKWCTVQLFLEEYGVAEVEVDQEHNKKVRCNCPSFSRMARCKHAKYVKENMERNNGHYSIHIPMEVDEKDAIEALRDPVLFRDFIIKYGKVEVID